MKDVEAVALLNLRKIDFTFRLEPERCNFMVNLQGVIEKCLKAVGNPVVVSAKDHSKIFAVSYRQLVELIGYVLSLKWTGFSMVSLTDLLCLPETTGRIPNEP